MTQRTLEIDIAGMHCASCSILVDDCVEDVPGVLSSRTNLKSGRCVAVVNESVTDDQVLAAVVEAGYTGLVVGV